MRFSVTVNKRVGGSEPITADVRLIAATHRDLARDATAGRFREDLLYRLQVVRITLPPLRARREDIPLLTAALLERIGRRLHKAPLRVTDEAMARLTAYPWPGNVRELENALTQCMVRARDGLLTPDLLSLPGAPASAGDRGPVADAPSPLQSLEEVEAAHIQRVLGHTGGHKGRTCEILGISRPALDRKIRKYRLTVPR
jgi:two-component system response regulator AtoC